jgi:hypothetical protein
MARRTTMEPRAAPARGRRRLSRPRLRARDAQGIAISYRPTVDLGTVQAGFGRTLRKIARSLIPQKRSPFADTIPHSDARFCEPSLRVPIEFAEFTEDGGRQSAAWWLAKPTVHETATPLQSLVREARLRRWYPPRAAHRFHPTPDVLMCSPPTMGIAAISPAGRGRRKSCAFLSNEGWQAPDCGSMGAEFRLCRA